MHDYFVRIGKQIVGDVCEFAERIGSQQVVWLQMHVPTDDLLNATREPVEMIGLDGTRVPCKIQAFVTNKSSEAEVLIEYLVPLRD